MEVRQYGDVPFRDKTFCPCVTATAELSPTRLLGEGQANSLLPLAFELFDRHRVTQNADRLALLRIRVMIVAHDALFHDDRQGKSA